MPPVLGGDTGNRGEMAELSPIGPHKSARQCPGAVFRIASIWASNRVSSTGLVW
jgi:hypothetical protein